MLPGGLIKALGSLTDQGVTNLVQAKHNGDMGMRHLCLIMSGAFMA